MTPTPLTANLLGDPYPTRPYLHAVDNDLTDVTRLFRSIVAYDRFDTKLSFDLDTKCTPIANAKGPRPNAVVGQLPCSFSRSFQLGPASSDRIT